MTLKIGIGGGGWFAECFIPLFQAHPGVDGVALAEVVPERRERVANEYGIKDTFEDIEQLCESDVDAIAIFTQRWMHGPQAAHALRAGKHVYSAVPMGITLQELATIVELAEERQLVYSMGETSYYYPPRSTAGSGTAAATSARSSTARASTCTTSPKASTRCSSAMATAGSRPPATLRCSTRATRSVSCSR